MSAADPIGQQLDELAAEQEHFAELVADLPSSDWRCPTPAEGWTVHDQVAHVVLVEELAALAVTDADAFASVAAAAGTDGVAFEADLERRGRALSPDDLLDRWARARARLSQGVRAAEGDIRFLWFGPPMRPRSFVAARLMETWAHGQDVRDALGVEAPDVPRLRTVADLGVRTRRWSYLVRGLEPDPTPFRVELDGPDDAVWTWGEGPLGVSGRALDFCAVVTQRRHWRSTSIRAHLPAASGWLEVAQAFAGPPTRTAPRRGTPANHPKEETQ